jgi:molybdopterin-guanine dinucleotide biosynthesis protein A
MKDLPPLNGLVLAGGYSRRMGKEKASLVYAGSDIPQWRITANLISPYCQSVAISVREDQTLEGYGEYDPHLLRDSDGSKGPMSGLLTAMAVHPDKAWLVVACDLPLLGNDVIDKLIRARGSPSAIAYRSSHDGLPEPLCTIYEPAMAPVLQRYFDEDIRCPRKVLIREEQSVLLLDLPRAEALDNANTPEDFERLNAMATDLKR